MHSVVAVSAHAANTGSQWWLGSCREGRPSGVGFSGKVMAKLPLAAHRWISSAAREGSHRGTRVSGIRRPRPAPAHHSSMIQSL